MSRDSFSYTHGDTGTAPSSSLNFDKNERPQAGHFDWYWYNVIEAINGHANEFGRLDSDDDGIVDEADEADTLDGEHASAFADAGHTHDGRYYTESEVDSNFNNYQDSDARSAINNDADHGSTASHNYFSGDHADLSGVGQDDHFNHATVAGTGSHDDLSNVSAGDHRSDSNIVNTVEATGTLATDISGDADTVDGKNAEDLGGGFFLRLTERYNNSFSPVGEVQDRVEYGDGGTKIYISQATENDDVYVYDLSTPYDISTMSLSQSYSVNQYGWTGMSFSQNGDYVLVEDGADGVAVYTLSTPWDLSSRNQSSVSRVNDVTDTVVGLAFNSDGSAIGVIDDSDYTLYSYSLSSNYDVSSLSLQGSTSLPSSSYYGMDCDPNGNWLFLNAETQVERFELNTTDDFSSITLYSVFNDVLPDGTGRGVSVTPNNMIVGTEDFNNPGLYQYST